MPLIGETEEPSSVVAPPTSPVHQLINHFDHSSKGTQTLKRPPKLGTTKGKLALKSLSETDLVNNIPVMEKKPDEAGQVILESQKAMNELLQSIAPIIGNLSNSRQIPEKRDLLNFLKEARERKIIFGGEPGENAKQFLKQVDNLNSLLPLNDLQLLKALQELLSGAARAWVKNHLPDFSSYNDFKVQFITYFVPSNYEAQLRLKICSRKQKLNESVTTFISEMRLMNSDLEKPFSESELIQTICLNLNEKFLVHVHLHEFTHLNQLEIFYAACSLTK